MVVIYITPPTISGGSWKGAVAVNLSVSVGDSIIIVIT